MNVAVSTVLGVRSYDDVSVTFDTTLLEIVDGDKVVRYPLVNVICFSTSESGPS